MLADVPSRWSSHIGRVDGLVRELGLPSLSVCEIIRKAFTEPEEFTALCKQANAPRRALGAGTLQRVPQGELQDVLDTSPVLRGVAELRGLPLAESLFPQPCTWMDRARERGTIQGRDRVLQARRIGGQSSPSIRYWCFPSDAFKSHHRSVTNPDGDVNKSRND